MNSAYSAGAPISQAAKLILDTKDGLINQADADAMLNELAGREAYRDVKKYLLQPSFSQQYNLSFSGASESDVLFPFRILCKREI